MYVVEVYVYNFTVVIIPTTRIQITQITQSILHGIHDVFQACSDDDKDPISTKILRKGDGTFYTKNVSWALSLMGKRKRYGSKGINVQHY